MTAPETTLDRPRTATAAGAGTPMVATVEVSAAPSERSDLVAQVAATIATITPASRQTGHDTDLRLHLAGGAVVRLTATAPARPEAYPCPTTILSVVVDDPGDLPDRLLTAILHATDHIGFTATEMALLREQLPLTATMPQHQPPGCLAKTAPVLTVHHMTDFLVMVEAITRWACPRRRSR